MCHSVDREPNVLMGGFNVAIHLMNIVVNKERREYKSETKRYIGGVSPFALWALCLWYSLYIIVSYYFGTSIGWGSSLTSTVNIPLRLVN